MESRTAGNEVMASLPSTSGAHWANRDNASGTLHSGDRGTTFRRPPAQDSYQEIPPADPDELSPSAYLPDLPSTSWFADADRRTRDNAPAAALPVRTPGSGLSGDLPVGAAATEAPARELEPVGKRGYGPGPGVDQRTYEPATAGRRAYESEPAPGYQPEPSEQDQYRPAPEFGPAPPATPGRISYGVSAGPISPHHRPTSPAAPAVPAQRPMSPAAPTASFADFAPTPSDTGTGRANTADRPDSIYKPVQAHRAPATGEPPRRRSKLTVFATAVLTALVLLGGGLAGMAYFSGDDTSMKEMLTLGAVDDDQTVSAPLGGRTTAQFELVDATTKATVRTADLGDDLYRITAPDGSGVRPSPVLSDDRVQLHLTADGRRASGDVDVLLSSKVSWALRFTAGADEQVVDLSSGQVSGLEVLGGVRRFQLKLPKPIGTVPLHVTGAIEDFSIQSPIGNPVRVKVDSGAKTVAAGKVTLKDVKPGSTLTPTGWNVTNRYDVDAAARVTLLSVGNA